MLLSRITQFLSLQLLQSTDNTETCVARFNHIVDVAIFSCIVRIGEQFRVFCFFLCKELSRVFLIFGFVGADSAAAFLGSLGIFQPMMAALIGLVPNCGASVLLAQLYMGGAITFGSFFAGLCSGAGIGLAVLWRVNPSWKQNLFMTGLLWFCGTCCGILLQWVV